MNNQPSFDRSLLIPVGVGVFSLLGLCILLVTGRLNATRAVVEELPTATAFQYAFIGTEPAVLTVTPMDPEDEPPTAAPEIPTAAPIQPTLPFETNTSAPIITLPPLVDTLTPSRTPTSASTAPFGPGTYDDTDGRFTYTGDWDRQTSVPGAYQNTLHVSGTLLNTLTFRFIGNELRIFFQSGPSLGTIRVTLDNNTYDMSEAGSSTEIFEWVLATTSTGTHTVTITHLSGGSVNFDSIIVPVVPATPTITPTSTTASS
ncbi:MAG TPA: hypothetical protein VK888_06435 [Anaerolineales bacterium]|nr:hypothetical protein [Anaerolineales bacterium]